MNQLDVTLSRSFKSGGVDIRPQLELFNALNANPVLTQINTFGPSPDNAVTVLNPKPLRVGLNVRF